MPQLPGGVQCDVEDPARVALLRAPDEPTRTYAYEATSPRPSNMALVFDPDGRLVSKQVKTYLTPIELPGPARPRARARSAAACRRCGRRSARWASSPPRTRGCPTSPQRLDQAGVDVLVQPEFFVGDTVRPEGPWAPDNLASSGYADVLRHPSIEALVLPELTGNVFDFSADAQQRVARQAALDAQRAAPRARRPAAVARVGGRDAVGGARPRPSRRA